MKKRKYLNTLIIKKDIDSKTYDELLEIMNPEMKQEYDQRKLKSKDKVSSSKKEDDIPTRLTQTIDSLPFRYNQIGRKRNNNSNFSTY